MKYVEARFAAGACFPWAVGAALEKGACQRSDHASDLLRPRKNKKGGTPTIHRTAPGGSRANS